MGNDAVITNDFRQQAQEAHQRAWNHVRGVHAHYLALGLELIGIRNERLFLAFSDSFPAYCAMPPESGGLGLQERSRQTCMQVANRFINELGVDPERLTEIPKSNLSTLVPDVTENNLEDVLADAQFLSNRDIRENKKNGKYSGKTQPLEATDEPGPAEDREWIECPNCGYHIRSSNQV